MGVSRETLALGTSRVLICHGLPLGLEGRHREGKPRVNSSSDRSDREALLASVPHVDGSTPLAAQLAEDTRRRIELSNASFPLPRQTRVFTVANQKGGVGKTTTSVNIAAALARAGARVLVIDNDPQGNTSTALNIPHHVGTLSTYDVLIKDRKSTRLNSSHVAISYAV